MQTIMYEFRWWHACTRKLEIGRELKQATKTSTTFINEGCRCIYILLEYLVI